MQRLVMCVLALGVGVTLTARQGGAQGSRVDVPAPDGLRANRTTFSPVMDVLRGTRPEVTDDQLDQLAELPLEAIWGALGDYRVNYVRGFTSTQPGARVAGRALTMRFLPPRPDLVKAIDTLADEGDWDRRYYARAAEEARPGDIVVAELGGSDGHNLFGAMGALGSKLRGVAGVIIDGGSRDLIELQDDMFDGFPVFARFFDVHTTSWLGVEWNAPVRIGEVTVLPGDVVVADDSGALFFPSTLAQSVLDSASARSELEEYERELLRSEMYRFRDVYPLSPELREEYETQRQRR
jgi:regulator of RNase E activity RraA|tara:strand:+ start:103 stop:987 length:885 start_codon:yes stop_codon:yes gene_type:complete